MKSDTVSALPDRGRELCSLTLYRRGDGTIKAVLVAMPSAVIEEIGDNVPKRLNAVSGWLECASLDVLEQSGKFDASPALWSTQECGSPMASPRPSAGGDTPSGHPESAARQEAAAGVRYDGRPTPRKGTPIDKLLIVSDSLSMNVRAQSVWRRLILEVVDMLTAPHPSPAQSEGASEGDLLLDWLQRNRLGLVPEFEGPWDVIDYGTGDDLKSLAGEQHCIASGNDPRSALRAAIAASTSGEGHE